MFSPLIVIAACLTLLPFLAAAFFGDSVSRHAGKLPNWVRLLRPAVLSVPYALVAWSAGNFRWGWFALYALLPVAVAALLWQAKAIDVAQRGNWRDFLVLAVLGLAVDLRWFEPAWPAHLAVFSKMLLLDAGIYGFLVIRQLDGVGFDLRLRLRDASIGLRELLLYTPIALVLGLALGFLHLHPGWPRLARLFGGFSSHSFSSPCRKSCSFADGCRTCWNAAWDDTPRSLSPRRSFGLSHFNKRAVHFNWRYVLLAALAGIFYGRAWRQERRVGASAITHASVDTIWSLWLR